MTISVLIIDDEPLAREGIRIRLKDYPEINVIGECKNGAEAIDSIRRLSPDLVFLDIKMPKTTGFDVVKTIGCENMPAIIFLTAYDEFAIEAFRVHAIDYLLKPINEKQLRDSLNNAFNIIQNKQLSTKTSQLTQLLNTLEQSTLKKAP